MANRILTKETYHFCFRVPIDEWEQEKILLAEGAGAEFIAPSNLQAIVKKTSLF